MPVNHFVTRNGLPPNNGLLPGYFIPRPILQLVLIPAPPPIPPPAPRPQVGRPPVPPNLGVVRVHAEPPPPPPPKTAPAAVAKGAANANQEGHFVQCGNGNTLAIAGEMCIFRVVMAPNYLPYENNQAMFPARDYEFPDNTTIKQVIAALIKAVCGGDIGDPAKCGITQCLEGGYGNWIKGATFMANGDDGKLNRTLKTLGWIPSKGIATKGRPIITAVHKG
ncbi:MAG: hypothetical protein M1834_006442 [Cirrosporium novae-zelandiae]|nr:MAG: hypothetical protein M1834_006442 [Cirrosporium novae-zelandiae]